VLHQKPECVAALVAHEALEDPAIRVDREIGPISSVERAWAPVALPCPFERDILADDLDDVRASPDLLDDVIGYHVPSPTPL